MSGLIAVWCNWCSQDPTTHSIQQLPTALIDNPQHLNSTLNTKIQKAEEGNIVTSSSSQLQAENRRVHEGFQKREGEAIAWRAATWQCCPKGHYIHPYECATSKYQVKTCRQADKHGWQNLRDTDLVQQSSPPRASGTILLKGTHLWHVGFWLRHARGEGEQIRHKCPPRLQLPAPQPLLPSFPFECFTAPSVLSATEMCSSRISPPSSHLLVVTRWASGALGS